MQKKQSFRFYNLINSIIMELSDDGDLYQKICLHKKKGFYLEEKEIWNILIQVRNFTLFFYSKLKKDYQSDQSSP